MSVLFKGFVGEVVIINGEKLFYTLDPAAEGHFWKNSDRNLVEKGVPIGARCWWLDSNDEVTYMGGIRIL